VDVRAEIDGNNVKRDSEKSCGGDKGFFIVFPNRKIGAAGLNVF
jgi:hypothetical protein